MNTQVIDHPLIASRLGVMREKNTDNATFRAALAELSTLLIYEALRDVEVETKTIDTPLTTTDAVTVRNTIVFVPILRAGLGMLDSATRLLPDANIDFVGMARDEDTHQPTSYLESLPASLAGKHVVILDPMLATGGSLVSCLDVLQARQPERITVVCVLAAPEGIERVKAHGNVDVIVTASIDQHLNENAYIVPGLGDAGDRQFGAADS